MSPPVGATGIQTCDGDESGTIARRFRVGANVGGFSSTVKFPGHDTDIRQLSTTATLDVRASERTTVQAALGAVVDGRLEVDGTIHDVRPGWLVAAAIAQRLVDAHGSTPFVLVSGSLGFGRAHTRERVAGASDVALTSVDLRGGVTVGWTLLDVLSPYLAARVFGGPVAWTLRGESVVGGDRYHYQLGGGLSVHTGRFDAYVEVAPLGEKRASAGLGVAF